MLNDAIRKNPATALTKNIRRNEDKWLLQGCAKILNLTCNCYSIHSPIILSDLIPLL